MKRTRSEQSPPPPDPAQEAHRRMMEEDRRGRAAEFEARGREWTFAASGWLSDWDSGGRERAEREQSEAVGRRKAAEAERAKEERAGRKRRNAEIRADYARWIKETEGEARRRAANHPERAAQLARDDAYSAYLWGIGAKLDAIMFDHTSKTARLDDLDYGIGPKARYYAHVPPPGHPPVGSIDPFAPLGLARGATTDQVKAAYRALAKRHHPDAGGDPAEFRRIKDAYDRCLAQVAPPPAS